MPTLFLYCVNLVNNVGTILILVNKTTRYSVCDYFVNKDIPKETKHAFDILSPSDKANGKENLMAKKNNYAEMAKDIYEFCANRGIWDDACIYFDFKAWATWDEWNGEYGKKIADGLYEYENKLCTDYFEYGNPHTLSMSFEGNLYGVFNYYWEDALYSKWHDEFYNLIGKYDCYFELGHAWNLTIVED